LRSSPFLPLCFCRSVDIVRICLMSVDRMGRRGAVIGFSGRGVVHRVFYSMGGVLGAGQRGVGRVFSLEIALFRVCPRFSQIFDHPNASKHPNECMTAVSAGLTNLGGGRRARPLQRVGGRVRKSANITLPGRTKINFKKATIALYNGGFWNVGMNPQMLPCVWLSASGEASKVKSETPTHAKPSVRP
jgi:hypothetical protein